MFRRILLILIILAILAIGMALLFQFRKQPAPLNLPTDQPSGSQPVTLLPPTTIAEEAPPGITLVSDIEASGYWIDIGDRTTYAVTDTGAIYAAAAPGGEAQILQAPIDELLEVLPSPRSPQALIVGIGRNGSRVFTIIDPLLAKSTLLPLDTAVAAWSPDGKEIALIRSGSLYRYTVAAAKSKLISPLPLLDIRLAWPSNDALVITTPPSNAVPGSAWLFDLKKLTLVVIREDMPDLDLRFYPGNQNGLRIGGGSALTVISPLVKDVGPLGVPSLPEKCVASGVAFYCAVPQNTIIDTEFAENYRQSAVQTNDALMIITPGSAPQIIYEPATPAVDAYNLTKVGNMLYFLNRYDNRLYSFTLQQ